jgi:hypothetical protein
MLMLMPIFETTVVSLSLGHNLASGHSYGKYKV